jgi:hypothetical protein
MPTIGAHITKEDFPAVVAAIVKAKMKPSKYAGRAILERVRRDAAKPTAQKKKAA